MGRFQSVLRNPDDVFFQTEGIPTKGVKTNDQFETENCSVRFIRKDHVLQVIADPSSTPIQRIKLRWKGDFSFIKTILKDAWCVANGDLSWNPTRPEDPLPW
ncbi:MAG TPA: hypothetical protein DDZ89_07250, partial [Clostridiales bacterium]|nr:hypothetical protein [Clostridiales bacterium]